MHTLTQQRKLYLDVLRILAAFLVCYNHTFAFELYLEQVPDGSLLSWVQVGTSALTTINLPLFFMISGALLLGKKESYRAHLKRVWRFLVLLVCSSGVTYLLLGERPLSGADFLKKLLSGDIYMNYWYLYAYLSLLLAKPLLQKIAECLSGKDILFLLILRAVFFSGTLTLNALAAFGYLSPIALSFDFQLPFITMDFLFYPLVGYYLSAKLPLQKIGNREVCICIAALLLGVGLTSALVYAEGWFLGFTQNYITLLSYLSAMAVFVLVRWGMQKVTLPDWLGRSIVRISSVTIGIYLLEPMVCHPLFQSFHHGMPWIPAVVTRTSLLWCLVCMILCGGLTCLLRLVPGVKKYL